MELFKRLARDELQALATAAVEVSVPKGAVIITQNGEGHEFLVMTKGSRPRLDTWLGWFALRHVLVNPLETSK